MGIGCIHQLVVAEKCKPVLKKVRDAKACKPYSTRSTLDHLLEPGEADIVRNIREAACSMYEPPQNVTDQDLEDFQDIAFSRYGFDNDLGQSSSL